MNFISTEYAVLLLLTFVAAALARGRAVTYVILAASVAFYGWWSPAYLLLLLAVIVLSWIGAIVVDRWQSRVMLAAVVAGELSLLLYFKYAAFIVRNLRAIGELAGRPIPVDVPSVLLPAGISFMTFQGVAYVVDVYRGELAPVRSFVDVAVFKSFFPQLVAGPIERGPHLLPQLKRLETGFIARAPLARALFMILKGVFLKFVIADNMSTVVNAMYANVAASSPADVVLGVLAFSIQIYGDFYGYTMIALGSALLFGIDLVNNFRHPYLATSIQDFWRRWHISLSLWFRDYLYIPLGGSRVALPRHLVNLLVVFFAVGLWHGANWTFVVWGAIHGAMIGVYVLFHHLARRGGIRVPRVLSAPAGWLVTFTLVTLAWIPFRAPDLRTPWLILAKLGQFMAHPTAFSSSVFGVSFYLWLGAVFVVTECLDASVDLERWFERMPSVAQSAVLLFLALTTYFGPLNDVAFLYFQF